MIVDVKGGVDGLFGALGAAEDDLKPHPGEGTPTHTLKSGRGRKRKMSHKMALYAALKKRSKRGRPRKTIQNKAAAVKKRSKRGRPRKTILNKAAASTTLVKRKRGRPRKITPTEQAQNEPSLDLKSAESQILEEKNTVTQSVLTAYDGELSDSEIFIVEVVNKKADAGEQQKSNSAGPLGNIRKNFACDHCDKRFFHKQTLSQHMSKHFGETKCPRCNLVLSRRIDMLKHLYMLHYFHKSILKKVKLGSICSMCNMPVDKDHMRLKHMDWRTCPECAKKYKSRPKMLHCLYSHFHRE
jgi:Zn finger protein HypA/HybF involved in hydrogenase expression